MTESDGIQRRLLLIDNHDAYLGVMEEVFVMEGFIVTRVHRREEAMPLFRTEQFDLILLDTVARVRADEGYERLGQLRTAAARIPIVLISGYGDADGLDPAQLEIAAIWTKPLELDELLAKVEALITPSVP